MNTKLNIWQTRDLTLFGRTMLVKTLGLSKLVYAASMLCVPEMVIINWGTRKKKQFFFWKNKNEKIKRSVIYTNLCQAMDLTFLTFATLKLALHVFKPYK